MAGLLQIGMEEEMPLKQPTDEGVGPQVDQRVGGSQEEQMDPETQDQFDAFVANGLRMIYSDKVGDNIVKSIIGSDDPVKGVADATLMIVQRLESAMSKHKFQIGDTAKVHGANILMGEIITMAETGGLEPLSEDQRLECWTTALAQYLDEAISSGKITPEQLQEMSQQIQQTPEGQEIAQRYQQVDDQKSQGMGQGGMMPTQEGM